MLLLGIDLGTSSIKVAVVDALTQRTLVTVQYPDTEAVITVRQPGWAEQSPETWWEYTQAAIRKAHASGAYDPKDIAAIGIAYQMHGLVVMDQEGKVLRDSIIWCDSRAVPYGDKAFAAIGEDRATGLLEREALGRGLDQGGGHRLERAWRCRAPIREHPRRDPARDGGRQRDRPGRDQEPPSAPPRGALAYLDDHVARRRSRSVQAGRRDQAGRQPRPDRHGLECRREQSPPLGFGGRIQVRSALSLAHVCLPFHFFAPSVPAASLTANESRSPRAARSARSPRCACVFTVPAEHPRISATVASGRSSA